VARLAGYEEYVNNQFEKYATDVDNYFGRYRQHPAVQFAVRIRQERSVGFDAVMTMAVHLEPPPALTPRVSFSTKIPDERWSREGAGQFAGLLQQFYRDADCQRFFNAHADMYQTAETRFQQVLNQVDFDWYQNFYGEVPKGTFNCYIGLLNGGGNFGPKVVHPDGAEDLYAIIGTWQVDSAGLPTYDKGVLRTVIHEYNHSFINHLIYANETQLRPAGEKIFPLVAAKMRTLAYGDWQVAFIESVVRAAVIRYQFDHERESPTGYRGVLAERNRGFLWIGELLTLLGTFEHNRAAYPTFRSFFPVIAGYFGDLSSRIDYEARSFDELSPKVSHIGPFANETNDVDPGITEIVVAFDRPLDPHAGYSINNGPGGSEHDPIEKVIGYNESGSSLTIKVKLKPDWDYSFVLTGLAFTTKDGYPLQPYTVKFKTKK
jgi:hypothetical protein